MHTGTTYVILAKSWMWLPDDGCTWTDTCPSSFYNFNCFNNLRILSFVCISWTIKCLILLMHSATMKLCEFCLPLFFLRCFHFIWFNLRLILSMCLSIFPNLFLLSFLPCLSFLICDVYPNLFSPLLWFLLSS